MQARRAYAGLVRDLSAPNGLFRESDGTYAHAWPFSQALAAAISISTVTRSRVDVAEVRRLVRLLPSYVDGGAYDATVSAPDGAGLQFFDDNEWLALDLVDASHLLGDRLLLRRAERVFGWISSGWDGDSSHACSGGVYWADTAAIRDRNTVTTANGQPAIFVAIYFRYLRALDAVAAQPQIAAALSRYVARHETSAPGTGSDVLDRAAAVQLSAELARSGGERTGRGGTGNTSDEGGR